MPRAKPTKIPKVPPAPPAPPPPPPTVSEHRASYVAFVAGRIENLSEGLKKWASTLATLATSEPLRFADRLDSLSAFENAAELLVLTRIHDALTGDNSKATLATVLDFATKAAISHGRFPRRSTSPTGNLTHQCEGAAWAQAAEDLAFWVAGTTRPDPLPPCEECGRAVEHAPICSKG